MGGSFYQSNLNQNCLVSPLQHPGYLLVPGKLYEFGTHSRLFNFVAT